MTGEIQETRIELHRFIAHVAQDRAAKVVNHNAFGHAQRVEGVNMGREKLFHGLREGEFDVHLPAPGQDHDEEGQTPPSTADGDGFVFAPVDLGDIPGRKGECQESLAVSRANRADVILDDADAPFVARVLQTLEDLLG